MDGKSLGVLTKRIPELCLRNVTPETTEMWVRAISHCCSETSLKDTVMSCVLEEMTNFI